MSEYNPYEWPEIDAAEFQEWLHEQERQLGSTAIKGNIILGEN